MDLMPMVSVITPSYKRCELLPRAIKSVLEQTYTNVQIVVVDDNNPDTDWRRDTEKMMERYTDDNRVKYVKHDHNMNGSVARNTGISEADGEIITFLDDDDVYYPDKIMKQVRFLLKNPSYRAVYCGWDQDGIVIPSTQGDCSFEILSGLNIILTDSIMMWRDDAIKCGGWDKMLKRHQEAAFLLRYFQSGGKIGVLPECLVKLDTSDRSNAAQNGIINEQHMNVFMQNYSDMIERCNKKRHGAKNEILANRYRAVMFAYVKFHDYLGAAKIWIKMTIKMPICFNKAVIKYVVGKGRNKE